MSWDVEELWHVMSHNSLTNSSLDTHDGSPQNMLNIHCLPSASILTD